MTTALKPCPFCGERKILHSAIRDGREVLCRNRDCGASTRAYAPGALRKVITAWNRRVSEGDPVITWPRPIWYEPAKGRPPGLRAEDVLPCDVEADQT